MDVALRYFDLLYNTFCLRSWVTKANESTFRDQYTQLLDHLRVCYGPNFDVISFAQDLIEFLLGLDFFEDREHLLYLFKLCCLCATTTSPTHPDVSITTAGHQSKFTDVILPCQSYMAGVSDSVTLCGDDSNLERFSPLSASIGRSAFSPSYDPWTYVDNFCRSRIYKALLASYCAVLTGPKKVSVRGETEESALKPPSDSERRRMEKSNSRSSSSSSMAGDPVPGTSKFQVYMCIKVHLHNCNLVDFCYYYYCF